MFALYSVLSNWTRDNNKIVANCFIPSGQDFKSLATFTRAFREVREFWDWGNFRTDISYTNRTFESFLALMKELTKKILDMTNAKTDIDFGLSLEEFELSEPEVFYFRMEKTANMPTYRKKTDTRSTTNSFGILVFCTRRSALIGAGLSCVRSRQKQKLLTVRMPHHAPNHWIPKICNSIPKKNAPDAFPAEVIEFRIASFLGSPWFSSAKIAMLNVVFEMETAP